MPGKFITVEGIEGAGKTTCIEVLAAQLGRHGIPYVLTREPGGTSLGEDLRALLLGHRHTGMAEATEVLLMFAARAEHLHAVIEPALQAGSWVICDRFTDATYAYQGGGRGLAKQRIATLEAWVQGERRPDLTLLLDLPVALGLTRAGKRSAPDRFESEAAAFFERVRAAYLSIATADPQRVKRVDSAQPQAQVAADLVEHLETFIRYVS